MKTRQIQHANGMALRIELGSYGAKLRLILLAAGVALLVFFPWGWGFSPQPDNRHALAVTVMAVILTTVFMGGAMAGNLIQIGPGRHIRKGWNILGFPIWLGSVPLSKITGFQPDLSDADHPILKCLDPSETSVLAIEGFRNAAEAEHLAIYLDRQLGDPEDSVSEFVKDIEATPSSDPGKSLRWGIAGTAFLFGIVLAVSDTGLTFKSQITSTVLAMAIAAIGLFVSLPDDQVTFSDAGEGIVRGWFRRRFFWIDNYVWNLKLSPNPVVTETRFDSRLPRLGLVWVFYGMLVFGLISLNSEQRRESNLKEAGESEVSEKQLELRQKAAERFHEHLKKRKMEQATPTGP